MVKTRSKVPGCPLCKRASLYGLADQRGAHGSTDDGLRAISEQLGQAFLRDVVRCHLAHHQGAPLAWSILQNLRPRLIRSAIVPLLNTRRWSSAEVQQAADLLALVVDTRDAPLLTSMIRSRSSEARAAGSRAAIALVEKGDARPKAVDLWVSTLLAAGPDWALGAGVLLLDLRLDMENRISAARRRSWARLLRRLRDPAADDLLARLVPPV